MISKPLYDILKLKHEFKWNVRATRRYELLRILLIPEPVLAIYSPTAHTEVHCDASAHGYGAVLLQGQKSHNKYHPVYYFSKRTTETESRYPQLLIRVFSHSICD